ncbi:hypothetical protein GWI33_014120, partial [Rhynchophorus ferrugineus]
FVNDDRVGTEAGTQPPSSPTFASPFPATRQSS